MKAKALLFSLSLFLFAGCSFGGMFGGNSTSEVSRSPISTTETMRSTPSVPPSPQISPLASPEFSPILSPSPSMTKSPSTGFSQTALPKEGEEIAVITTEKGDIKIRFFPEQAPKAVENFITHAKDGYYDGLIFHRVINGFMIQGGDPNGTGMGGESIWGSPFEDEFSSDLQNIRGSLSMANAGPSTNGSQFFINQVPNLFLDNRHTVFGQVYEGIDVIDEIASVQTNDSDAPVDSITMKIEIIPYKE
jgi:peptidyl-prolyl cis-trans isomerase B (cyclophilin B)